MGTRSYSNSGLNNIMLPSRIYIDGKLVVGATNPDTARMMTNSADPDSINLRHMVKKSAQTLKVGDSFLIPYTIENVTGNLYRDTGKRFKRSKEMEFSRITRIE